MNCEGDDLCKFCGAPLLFQDVPHGAKWLHVLRKADGRTSVQTRCPGRDTSALPLGERYQEVLV